MIKLLLSAIDAVCLLQHCSKEQPFPLGQGQWLTITDYRIHLTVRFAVIRVQQEMRVGGYWADDLVSRQTHLRKVTLAAAKHKGMCH